MTGKGSVVRFDAGAGGRLTERHEKGKSLLWHTLLICDPGVAVHLVGQMSPEWGGGPSTSMIKFLLEDRNGGTLLRVADPVFEHVTDETARSLEDGWRRMKTDRLKAYLEAA